MRGSGAYSRVLRIALLVAAVVFGGALLGAPGPWALAQQPAEERPSLAAGTAQFDCSDEDSLRIDHVDYAEPESGQRSEAPDMTPQEALDAQRRALDSFLDASGAAAVTAAEFDEDAAAFRADAASALTYEREGRVLAHASLPLLGGSWVVDTLAACERALLEPGSYADGDGS